MLRILHVDDDEDDFELTKNLLVQVFGKQLTVHWESDWSRSLVLLRDGAYDICLLDYFLGVRNGIELVAEAIHSGVELPLILLTGRGSRDVDLAAMRAGAADYLDKNCLSAALLERSIRYAIRHVKTSRKAELLVPDRAPRLLLIEDDEDDFILTQAMLREVHGSDYVLDWVSDWQDAITQLSHEAHDVYLVDYRLGARNGLDLVTEAQARGCTAPIIMLTGQGNRELDLEAMKAGASDYLVKSEISAPLLDRAIRYALERKRGQQRLTEMAQFDQLTRLANRALFLDYLGRAMARADRQRQPIALLYLDLDRFKIINDTYGHEVGDALLIRVAERLQHCVRASDLVARLGGDEFTVVIDGVSDPKILSHFADRILAALREPIKVGPYELATAASIGIAVYPEDGDTQDELIRAADEAMYRAKESGAGCFSFYTIVMQIAGLHRRVLEHGLRDALDKDQFEIWYQPQMDIATGRMSGVEALLRWMHPEKGMIQPGDFIGLAEETGLIVPIGEWVFSAVCDLARELDSPDFDNLTLAVNFSARQFQERDLAKSVKNILSRSGVSPQMLEIELTESSILRDPERAREVLRVFAGLGLNLALDDFGTGYSSLKHLQNFPGGTIKIDRSFVSNVVSNSDDASIVRAIISMAHNLRLKVVAEGVETKEQLNFLAELNCDSIQGFLFCEPMPAKDIVQVFQSMKGLRSQTAGLVATDGTPLRGPGQEPGPLSDDPRSLHLLTSG